MTQQIKAAIKRFLDLKRNDTKELTKPKQTHRLGERTRLLREQVRGLGWTCINFALKLKPVIPGCRHCLLFFQLLKALRDFH